MKTLYLLDFDGTLSKVDSSKYFYSQVVNPLQYLFCIYLYPFWHLIKYFVFKRNSFYIKKCRTKIIFKCAKKNLIDSYIHESDKHIDRILKPGVINFIRKLIANPENDVYIVSASLSFVLERWAKRENIRLITNDVMIKENSRISFCNDFDCDGIGKALLIKKNINLLDYNSIIAYGDTSNDFHMFLLANTFYHKPNFNNV